MRIRPTFVAIAVCLSVTGCTLEDGAGPTPTGPSEFALSVTLSATPDHLPRDGNSQSVITITVRDDSSRPVAGQRLNVSSNIGTLSENDVVTDSSGQASLAFTAPASGTIGNEALISVFPVGTNAANAVFPRTLTIRFTGAPNLKEPVPDFETTPAAPEVNQSVRFDGSKTRDEGNAPCLDCTYDWDFGDGATAVGRVVNHTFTVARTHLVTLTVTDAAGTRASIVKPVAVNTVDAPTVKLSVIPDPPLVNQQAVFTADAKPANGHSIQRYEWSFGDGTTETTTTPTVAKTYDTVGIRVVTVTAFDDLGQAGKAAKSVDVQYGVGAPVANFTIAPSSPAVGVSVTFDGSTSTVGAGATIERYVWNPGDGSSAIDSGASPVQVGSYGAPGTYQVTLTITDSLGRQATKTVSVTVVP